MLKKFRPVSLILFVGVLCFPKTYAETETVKPEVEIFSAKLGKSQEQLRMISAP